MKVLSSEKKNQDKQVEVKVEISAEEFNAAVNKAYVKMRGRINVPGWRKGKAPRKLIESMYGEGVFYEEAFESVSPEALSVALADGLRIVGTPSISDFSVNEDKSAWMCFLLTLYPEIKLGEYKGIEAPRASTEVTDDEVDREIKSVQQRNARIVDVDRPAEMGDTVELSYKGTIDGVEFEGGSSDSYELELGSGSFIPGFEEQVVGISAGEERDVNVTFPEQYHSADVAGKAAVFHIKAAAVKVKELPELDDEFAKDVSEYDTLEEYKASVAAELKKAKEARVDNEFRSLVLEKVADNAEGDVPEVMIDERVNNYVNNYAANLQAQGLSMDMYLQFMGTTLDEFKNTLRPSAGKSIKVDLALEKVAEAENLQPTEEAIEAEFKSIAEQYNMDVEKVKAAVSADDLAADLKRKLAEQLIVDNAVATELKAEEPAAEAEETPAESEQAE